MTFHFILISVSKHLFLISFPCVLTLTVRIRMSNCFYVFMLRFILEVEGHHRAALALLDVISQSRLKMIFREKTSGQKKQKNKQLLIFINEVRSTKS